MDWTLVLSGGADKESTLSHASEESCGVTKCGVCGCFRGVRTIRPPGRASDAPSGGAGRVRPRANAAAWWGNWHAEVYRGAAVRPGVTLGMGLAQLHWGVHVCACGAVSAAPAVASSCPVSSPHPGGTMCLCDTVVRGLETPGRYSRPSPLGTARQSDAASVTQSCRCVPSAGRQPRVADCT